MACVVAWFCECGSSVRMSFCAAQRRFAASADPAMSVRMSNRYRTVPPLPLFERQGLFHQRREVARAERDHLVVEIVVRVVQQAAAGGAALAEEYIRAGP